MMELPAGVTPEDELEVEWARNERSTQVFATLGGVTIGLDIDHDAVETVPWLLAAMPSVLEAAWVHIEEAQRATTD